jgi:hypothetical protein
VTREILADLSTRAFSKSSWHSLMAALVSVSEEAFVWIPERHNGFPWMNGSIQDIVYHVAGDKLVQLNHAFGDATMTWDDVPVTKSNKAELVAQLEASQRELILAINNAADLDLKISGWGGKRLKTVDFFVMLIEHDLYHAGQIRYIRNLVA